jgi:hypothetical protein
MRHELPVLTRFALHLHARAARGTTVLHGVQGAALAVGRSGHLRMA